MNHKTPFVILSAEKSGLGNTLNAERSAALFDRLNMLGHTPATCDGVYKGRAETAYLVPLNAGDSNGRYDEIAALARFWEQDCILYVDGARRAYFDNTRDGKPALAGSWVEYTGPGPLPDSYTVTPDGRYWQISPV